MKHERGFGGPMRPDRVDLIRKAIVDFVDGPFSHSLIEACPDLRSFQITMTWKAHAAMALLWPDTTTGELDIAIGEADESLCAAYRRAKDCQE